MKRMISEASPPKVNNFLPMDCSWQTDEDRKDEFEHQVLNLQGLHIECRISMGILEHIRDMVVDLGVPKDKFWDWVKKEFKP